MRFYGRYDESEFWSHHKLHTKVGAVFLASHSFSLQSFFCHALQFFGLKSGADNKYHYECKLGRTGAMKRKLWTGVFLY